MLGFLNYVVVTVATAGMGTIAAGAIIGAAGGFTGGSVGTWLNGGSFWQGVGAGALNGAIGAVAGVVGGAAAGLATKSVGSFAINGLGVAHRSAIGGFVAGSIGGAAGGGASGFAVGMLMTGGDIEQAWKMAGQGAIFGGIAGAGLGLYRGCKSAMPGTNRWTGNTKSKVKVQYPSVGAQGKKVTAKLINNKYLKKNRLDAHEIKYEYLGKGAKISNFDLYKVPSGQVVIMPKGGYGNPIWTDYSIY